MTTSSSSGPTVTTFAPPVLRTINEDEEVMVSGDAEENYYFSAPEGVNDSVFKCPGCKMLTIHQGYQCVGHPVHNLAGGDQILRRIYLCTHCGKFSSK